MRQLSLILFIYSLSLGAGGSKPSSPTGWVEIEPLDIEMAEISSKRFVSDTERNLLEQVRIAQIHLGRKSFPLAAIFFRQAMQNAELSGYRRLALILRTKVLQLEQPVGCGVVVGFEIWMQANPAFLIAHKPQELPQGSELFRTSSPTQGLCQWPV